MTEKQPKDDGARGEDFSSDVILDAHTADPLDGGSCTFALTVAYDGAGFSGFARQPSQTTVQGELERALFTVFQQEVATVGAGRTDAGVHARGQVVSFVIPRQIIEGRSLDRLRSSLNALTPDGLVIQSIDEKPKGFSARFSAQAREYRYRVVTGPVPPVFLKNYAWWVPAYNRYLDSKVMREAAAYLIGEHDFKTFCVAKSAEEQATMRCLDQVTIFFTKHLGEKCMVIQIVGNAFLHSMVRIIVGSLVEVGLGNRPAVWMGEILAAKDRRAAGQTAPAHGLTLWDVRY